MKKRATNIFEATNPLRILAFLSARPGKEFLGSEIQKALKISRMGVYLVLGALERKKLVVKHAKGKFLTYSVDYGHPVVKQFKILCQIAALEPLLRSLGPVSKKIVLFGSASRGEDAVDSDIDLFVLTAEPEEIQKKNPQQWCGRKIQAVIKTPSDWAEFKDKDPIFYDEVNRGIVLWEAQE